MSVFLSETPLLLQWLPWMDRGMIVGVNRLGQVLIVVAGMMAVYQEQLLTTILQMFGCAAQASNA